MFNHQFGVLAGSLRETPIHGQRRKPLAGTLLVD